MSQTGVVAWSQTASDNATADSNINWAEGMAPSAVNNSSRAQMSSVAKYRDDTAGSLTTGGSSTAYTVTTNQVFSALSVLNGQTLSIRFNVANGAAATLNVDGLGAKAIQTASGVAAPAGIIAANSIFDVTYDNSIPAFLLHGRTALATIEGAAPIGGGMDFWGSTAPTGWIFAYGQAISRTTYSALFAVLSTTYGTGDGSTTFNVPDMRGRSSFGKDNMGGTAANRLTGQTNGIDGTALGNTGGEEKHTLTKAEAPSGLITMTDPGHLHTYSKTSGNTSGTTFNASAVNSNYNFTTDNTSTATTGITLTDHGSDGAHNTLPPGIVCNYIIFAGV